MQVSLKFWPPKAVPGERTSMYLSAQPGSLCGLSAVDQSVLILEPGKRLNAQKVTIATLQINRDSVHTHTLCEISNVTVDLECCYGNLLGIQALPWFQDEDTLIHSTEATQRARLS